MPGEIGHVYAAIGVFLSVTMRSHSSTRSLYLEFECGFDVLAQQVTNVLVVDLEVRRANEISSAGGHRRGVEDVLQS